LNRAQLLLLDKNSTLKLRLMQIGLKNIFICRLAWKKNSPYANAISTTTNIVVRVKSSRIR